MLSYILRLRLIIYQRKVRPACQEAVNDIVYDSVKLTADFGHIWLVVSNLFSLEHSGRKYKSYALFSVIAHCFRVCMPFPLSDFAFHLEILLSTVFSFERPQWK